MNEQNLSNEWQWITVSPNSPLFNIVQQVMKQATDKKPETIIEVVNKTRSEANRVVIKDRYKIAFDWQEDHCGIEVYKHRGT